ncbi:MAG: hypothetical protein LBV41_04995 [Cytophagaceae bacterium]|nr:hypothetical protein [Cytophagaceae bacterium]
MAEKQIVLDGKKLKGVSPASKGTSGCYILNAWVSENRLCVGQNKVEGKTHRSYDSVEEIEKDHGRIETRGCPILHAKDFLLEDNLLFGKTSRP